MNDISLNGYTTFSIYSSVDRCLWFLYSFWSLCVMLLWTFTNKFLFDFVFISLGYSSMSRIARSYGNFMFTFWGIAKVFLQSDCTVVYSYLKGLEFFRSLNATCNDWFLMSVLTCLKWFQSGFDSSLWQMTLKIADGHKCIMFGEMCPELWPSFQLGYLSSLCMSTHFFIAVNFHYLQ